MTRRILLLITDLKIGGTPTVVRELALRLTATGVAHVEVTCLAPTGPVADQIAQAGIGVTPLNASSNLSFPVVVWRLIRLIRDRKIDTVLSFLVHANLAAAAAAQLCRGVRWFQSIQTTQPYPSWHWRVQAIAQRAAARIVVPSASVAHVAQKWARVPAAKIVVIPNAVDSGTGILPVLGGANLQTAFSLNATGHGQDAHATNIGFIGRLDSIKRIPDLLEAMKLLDDSVHLHIFGEGAERQHIEQTLLRLALGSRVTLHGAVAGAQSALAHSDLLVLCSEAEGFGLVLIEAMAAGVPVVATNVPGIRDVVRHGETGWLVPVASPARLAEGIAMLLKDKNRREAMIANARADVRTRFSWDSVLRQYRTLFGISG